MSSVFREVLVRGLGEMNLSLDPAKLDQMERYAEMLLDWNEKINLTAITDPEEVAIKHFLDSLTCIQVFAFYGPKSVIDVGTGAGFPGLPLKILFPRLQLTLLDSLQKRCKFLQAVVDELGLTDVAVVHGRAEEKAQDRTLRGKFDLVTARAVTKLPVLSEYCLPFLHKKGMFIAYKGPEVDEELKSAAGALKVLGGAVSRVTALKLPISGEPRTLVVIEKKAGTPEIYPRRPGIPEKTPLV